jgi:predicted DNA-binding transcriptional regulator AlpA
MLDISPEAGLPDQLLSQGKVRKLCGGISDMTLWRWRQTGGFPAATIIHGRSYYSLKQVVAWVNAHVLSDQKPQRIPDEEKGRRTAKPVAR